MSMPLPRRMDWRMYGWMIRRMDLDDLGQPISLLRGGNTLTTVSPPDKALSLCEPRSALLIKALLSLVTSCHLCLFVSAVSSWTFRPFSLWLSSATWLTPADPWQQRKFTSCFRLLLWLASNHSLLLSLPLLFLSWFPLSASQWQSRTLAVGVGLPVLAPPLLLSVPPPSL